MGGSRRGRGGGRAPAEDEQRHRARTPGGEEPEMAQERPLVGVVMGSDSDWPVMEAAGQALAEFDVPFEAGVYSAHRTPQRMLDYALSLIHI